MGLEDWSIYGHYVTHYVVYKPDGKYALKNETIMTINQVVLNSVVS